MMKVKIFHLLDVSYIANIFLLIVSHYLILLRHLHDSFIIQYAKPKHDYELSRELARWCWNEGICQSIHNGCSSWWFSGMMVFIRLSNACACHNGRNISFYLLENINSVKTEDLANFLFMHKAWENFGCLQFFCPSPWSVQDVGLHARHVSSVSTVDSGK